MKKKNTSKKAQWKDMKIKKVKLNPEQAVLSCCVTMGGGRGKSYNNNSYVSS